MIEALFKHWRVLLSSQSNMNSVLVASKADSKSQKEEVSEEAPKPPPASDTSKPKSDANKPPPDWNFGMFGPTAGGQKGGSQGQGRQFGGEQGPDQTKMLIFGALGFAAFVSALTFFEMGYKEISWKDFVNK